MDYSRLAKVLSSNGFSLTQARKRVFGALVDQEGISMNELICELSGTVDRVSVYRNVTLFEKLGILQRISNGFKYKVELSDSFSSHHHHLSCSQCGQIINIKADQLEGAIKQLGKDHGFVISGHQVEIHGSCAQCALKGKEVG
ncbi:transcriptional repressor [Patescibacteria group bacterium]|jgi:Fe2+ or Zn2+ uptake regulation protein|nr:transcriptional repressor [Patescibacteria group bacterium]